MRENTIHTQFDEDQIENERERENKVSQQQTRGNPRLASPKHFERNKG